MGYAHLGSKTTTYDIIGYVGYPYISEKFLNDGEPWSVAPVAKFSNGSEWVAKLTSAGEAYWDVSADEFDAAAPALYFDVVLAPAPPLDGADDRPERLYGVGRIVALLPTAYAFH